MPARVLIVDDSAFMRRALRGMLEHGGEIQVVGFADNGREAIEQVLALKPDVVTMDVEMPVLDGVSAVRRIMARCPTPILMFSSLTEEGATATLDALDAGAIDFLPKRLSDLAKDRAQVERILREKVLHVASAGRRMSLERKRAGSARLPPDKPKPAAAEPARSSLPRPALIEASRPAPVAANRPSGRRRSPPYRLVLIGTSTGGPKALQEIISRLPAGFPLPIVLIQHMPANFTSTFAQRLDQTSALHVKEAQNGDRLLPGQVLLAPGGRQLRFERRGDEVAIRVEEATAEQIYKPSVDIAFGSAAEVFGASVLAVVLTGMGADGREGARTLVADGATVWAQDEESCVIYGMPKAVVDAGLSERVVSLTELPDLLQEEV
ncbi:MAG: protein-glutamate methylesterase/protein-glutamine glutaminase [Pseudomonadota bacterium]